MLKIGEDLRSAIKAGNTNEAVKNVLQNLALTEDEAKHPWNHKKVLEQKLAVARELDIMDLFENLHGSVRSRVVDEQGWRETQAIRESGEMKARMSATRPIFEDLNESANTGFRLEEAEVMSNVFQLLTQAKLYTTMMAVYNLTPATYEQLAGTFDSPFEAYDHQIPSEAPALSFVKEGEEYPEAPIADRYCQTRAFKFGRRISLTREVLITDRTGKVVETAEGLAKSAKYREDELAALAWADSSNATLVTDAAIADAGAYWPERTQCALYRTAAGSTKADYEYSINKIAGNDLQVWKNISDALILLRKMQNLKSQYIDVFNGGNIKIVVPFGLEQRANLVTSLGAISQIDQNNAAGNESAFVRVPEYIQNMGIKSAKVIVWDKLASAATSAQSTWYLAGDVSQAFRKHQRWGVEFSRATPAQLGGADFKADVLMSVRGGFNAGFRWVDDKYCIQSTHS